MMRELRLLLITDALYPYLNANSEIVYRLARELGKKYSCQITILGSNERDICSQEDGIRTCSFHSIEKYHSIQENNPQKWKRMLKIICDPECLRYYATIKINHKAAEHKEYLYAISKELKREKYDCIIGFSNPFDSLRALSRIQTRVPYIAYKLDPCANRFYHDHYKWRKKEEERADRKAAAIITTDLIRNDYPSNTKKDIIEKINVLQFPNVIRYNREPLGLGDKDHIHCVFTGTLYREIRNPRYTIELFAALKQEPVTFHIFGMNYSALPECLPDNVITHGLVLSDEALGYMQGADVLVNIGNAFLNLMPSKLLTYISLGKPILNIIKDRRCPTIPYIDKYPLKLSVLETTEPTKDDIGRVRDFILSSKGKHVPFEQIEKLYEDCTPEYVGKKFYDIICGTIEKTTLF